MTLEEIIQDYKRIPGDNTPTDVLEVMARQVSLLQSLQMADNALGVGDRFPDFELPDNSCQPHGLADLLAHGPVIVSFFRGGWCPYCVMELKALRDNISQIKAFNTTLVAITPESKSYTTPTIEENELNFVVLSDRHNQLAKQCGLAFLLSDEHQSVLTNFGIDLPSRHDSEHFELPIPATYVIDQQGTIRYAYVEESYTRRAKPEAILAVLKAL